MGRPSGRRNQERIEVAAAGRTQPRKPLAPRFPRGDCATADPAPVPWTHGLVRQHVTSSAGLSQVRGGTGYSGLCVLVSGSDPLTKSARVSEGVMTVARGVATGTAGHDPWSAAHGRFRVSRRNRPPQLPQDRSGAHASTPETWSEPSDWRMCGPCRYRQATIARSRSKFEGDK
jgi:hypothetical protein